MEGQGNKQGQSQEGVRMCGGRVEKVKEVGTFP